MNTPPSNSEGLPTPTNIADHELVRRIGRGSYGEVWLARNVMGNYRAVKIVRRQSFDDDRPFQREFTGIQRFEPISRSHPSQVQILHVGRGEDYFYYIMELADDEQTGQNIDPEAYSPRTLRSDLFRRGRLDFEETVRIALGLTTALEHLHRNALVHRDIKPSNIIFVNGIPKLADIGLVASVDATRSYVGTEGFAPPEGPGTPQADIYSVGKVIYEMCTGRDRQEFPELPTDLAERNDRLALLEINAVVARACHPEPGKRYSSAAEVETDLLLIQSGKSVARLHSLERAFALAKRISAVGLIVATAAITAFLWQSRQSHQFERLATQNKELALKSEESAKAARQTLASMRTVNGLHALDDGDLAVAALWFAEALKSVDAKNDNMHRERLGTVLRYQPKLLAVHDVNALGWGKFWGPTPDLQQVFARKGPGTICAYGLFTGAEAVLLNETNAFKTGMYINAHRAFTFYTNGPGVLWDLETQTAVRTVPQFWEQIPRVTFNFDFSKAAFIGDRTVTIWDLTTTNSMGVALQHSSTVSAVLFSPDGTRIATGCGTTFDSPGLARVWDAHTGEPLTRWLEQPRGPVGHLVFSPDGRMLITRGETRFTGAGESASRVWDSDTGRLCYALTHTDTIFSSQFSPDGRWVATASADHTAKLWRAQTGQLACSPWKYGDIVWTAAFSPDSSTLAIAAGKMVYFMSTGTGQKTIPPVHHESDVELIRFDESGRLLATLSMERLHRVWDLGAAEPESPPLLNSAPVVRVAFTPDSSRAVTADADDRAYAWDTANGALIHGPLRTGESSNPWTRNLSPNGSRIVAPAGSNTAGIWNLTSGERVGSLLYHSNAIRYLKFSDDGSRVVTGSADCTARVWDAATGRPLTPPLPHSNAVRNVCFSPDGRYVATSCLDETARVWDAWTGEPVTAPLPHTAVSHAAFSHDNRLLATIGNESPSTTKLWQIRSERETNMPFDHGDRIDWVIFSPDSRLMVTASRDSTARIWDVVRRGLVAVLQHAGAVGWASFSSDGREIITCSRDGSARVWDAATGEALSSRFMHSLPVLTAQFNRDGTRIITGGLDGIAQVWDLPKALWWFEDLSSVAQLLAGFCIDDSGRLVPLLPQKVQEMHERLKAEYPDYFEQSPEHVLRWHRRRLAVNELNQNWSGAKFHLDKLEEFGCKDMALAKHRKRILACQTLPRDPAATSQLIDLSPYYTTALAAPFSVQMPDNINTLALLPAGLQSFAGEQFDIRGIIRFWTHPIEDYTRPLWSVTDRVNNITIRQVCRRIHFLHASEGAHAIDGEKIGSYVVHYKNGQQHEIPIVYGQDLRDWFWFSNDKEPASRAEVVWESEASGKGGNEPVDGTRQRLYKRTWENPLPDTEITALDFVSARSKKAAPFLIAITVE